MLTRQNLQQIAPTNHSPQSAYSLNLWRWARRALKTDRSRLFVAFANKQDETEREYDPEKTQASRLYIGHGDIDDGWLHGSRLSEILCNGTKSGGFAYPPRMGFVIVPDWWQRYIAGGKCIIDPEHWLYADRERWKVSDSGRERTCLWCGNHSQYQHRQLMIKKEWRSRCAE